MTTATGDARRNLEFQQLMIMPFLQPWLSCVDGVMCGPNKLMGKLRHALKETLWASASCSYNSSSKGQLHERQNRTTITLNFRFCASCFDFSYHSVKENSYRIFGQCW